MPPADPPRGNRSSRQSQWPTRSPPESARLTRRQKALRALARRDHSRAELARNLRRRARGDDINGAADDGAIDALLDEFEANGWLSDERFAATAARHRQ